MAVALALVIGFAQLLCGQQLAAKHSIVKDWTQHHVVFSNPGTREQAIQSRTLDRWEGIVNDPRYQMWQEDRSAMAALAPSPASQPPQDDSGDGPLEPDTPPPFFNGPLPRGLHTAVIAPPASAPAVPDKRRRRRMKTDWQETEGTNGTTGLGEFPATYTVSATSINCGGDFAVFNTGLTGSATQATIVAYNNLYSSCTGSPTFYWAYNTGTGASVINSVVFSKTATQVAFIQAAASTGVANLVLLKWKGVSTGGSNGTLSVPATPTAAASASAYTTCTASCSWTVALNGSPTDTYSSPYYDFSTDTLYVGDDAGKLHKFTGVFNGTVAEVTTNWPVSVNTNAALGSPVYDSGSTNVFVGDYALGFASNCQPSSSTTNSPCGYLYSISSAATPVLTKSVQLDYNYGIIDSPIIDSGAAKVYAFVGADNTTSCSSGPCAGVFQFPVGFTATTTPTEAKVGPGYQFLMSGTFDNAYFNSSNQTGHMYVVGNTGPANNALYQLSISGNALSTSTTNIATVSDNYTNGYYASGLQVSEFLNGSTDYVFLSVLSYGHPAGCTSPNLSNGCVIGYNVTTPASVTLTGSSPAGGGSSGIIIDNGAAGTGNSNVYFSTLLNQTCTTSGGSGGCSIQISQAAP
jgi:hypothetical protein